MLFSEFVNIMFKHCDSTYKSHEYFLHLFNNIMRDPETPEEIKLSEDGQYNPFEKLVPDTLERYFKGANPINPRRVHQVLIRKDTDKFARYIDSLNWNNQLAIEEEIKKMISNFNPDDNLSYACADLFLQILDDIFEGRESSNIENSKPPSKFKAYPTATIFYDETDGKLHIGETEINIPKELEPPKDIAPEEEVYVNELLAAYADALKSGELTLESLPIKFKRNFSDQRINYYSAMRIDRFVRDAFKEGDIQANKWKHDTLDYIKDTLWDDYDDGYRRLVAVMKKVVDGNTTSVIDTFHNLVGPREKKGACHLLVNDGSVRWVDEIGK